MTYVVAAPEMMAAAATDLGAIRSTLDAAHMVAAAPTVAVTPAAADEVSAGIAHLFSQHAQDYQAMAAKAAAFHGQFVGNLKASAASYTSADAANTSLLQGLNNFLATPLGQTPLVQNLAGIAVSAVFFGAFFGFFLVLVPSAIVLVYIQGVIEYLGSLLP